MGLTASVTESLTGVITSSATASLTATATLAESPTVQYYATAPLVVTVTCAITSGYITLGVPSSQPGYQYVHDTPSTGLPNGYREYISVGVPGVNLGSNGDLYRRADGVIGTNSLYARASGAWTAIN